MTSLTQEIINWYAKRGKELSKMTDPTRMPQGVTREQVEVAAVQFYNEIATDDFEARVLVLTNGKKVKYLDIAWRIWAMASGVNSDEYTEGHKKMLGAAKVIQAMDDNHRAFAKKANRERYALVAGLWCWLIWEIYRALGS